MQVDTVGLQAGEEAIAGQTICIYQEDFCQALGMGSDEAACGSQPLRSQGLGSHDGLAAR
jgi:hypothetical protein